MLVENVISTDMCELKIIYLNTRKSFLVYSIKNSAGKILFMVIDLRNLDEFVRNYILPSSEVFRYHADSCSVNTKLH